VEVSASVLVNARSTAELEQVRIRARTYSQACALTWGWGACGQLGHGDYENQYSPKVVEEIHKMSWSTVISADCGAAHTAAIVGRNEAYAHDHEVHDHGALVAKPAAEASRAVGADADLPEEYVRLVGGQKKVFTWGLGLPAAGEMDNRYCGCTIAFAMHHPPSPARFAYTRLQPSLCSHATPRNILY
jgi:hypothetical protein